MMTTTTDPIPAPANPRRRWFAGLAALGGLTLLGAQAQAQGWGRHGRLDPEESARRMDYRIGRLVADVGGTAQQKERLVAIARAALTELRPLREQARTARLQSVALLAAPVIDRAAMEQARLAQVRAQDASSRRLTQAMADAAEVLTPEQRVKAAERLKHRIERHRRA